MDFNVVLDLDTVKLEDNGYTWLHTMPIGTYNHGVWGKIEFTVDRLLRFAQNIKSKVRGVDPDVDYDHKDDPAKGKKAAGWVKDAKVDTSGLWLAVEWTPEGRKSIQDREYRYISPEFKDKWTHERTGESFQDVLFGAALTNRPFLKDLLPITMSEIRPAMEVGLSEQVTTLSERVDTMEKLLEGFFVNLKRGGR